MKISINWLKNFISFEKTPEDIAYLLTHSGLEVEGIEVFQQVEENLKGVVIGEVVSCEKHPEADKLFLTKVDIGNNIISPIVCGAQNVATGQKVVVATPGTTLYPTQGDPFTIKKAKIRGAVSEGMICAEDEIGLGISHDGIIVLNTDLAPGTPAAVYFKLEHDHILEIGLTPNRADAASHLGVARDLKVLLKKPLHYPTSDPIKVDNNDLRIEVVVENHDACPRYSGITLSGVKVQDSPDWLRTKLKSIGVASINNIVDATNYVLHDLGQPLHAFDADKIAGKKVIIKTLPEGSEFTTLDGKQRRLNSNDLMICDESGGMCIAGVFGGLDSGISDTTKNIFLESAFFSPDYIRKTALVHSLKTDASFRFERGTDPEITVYALQKAALLIQEVAGGSISSDIIDYYPKKIEPFEVHVLYKNIDRLIGKQLEKETIHTILENLDINIKNKQEKGFTAYVPTYRVDVQREVDIIEEILRIYGYDNIPVSESLRSDYLAEFEEIDKEKLQYEISGQLASQGFYEIITNSLTKPGYAENAAGLQAEESVNILNKLSEDLAVLRQSLLFSGLEVILYNINRRQKDLKLFEFGKHYKKTSTGFQEEVHLGIFMTGDKEKESWIKETLIVDFHDLYSVIQKILLRFNVIDYRSELVKHPFFSYALQIYNKELPLIIFGKVDKQLLKITELKQEVFYADVHWENLLKQKEKTLHVQEISKYPEVRRDLSLVIPQRISFEQIKQIAQNVESDLVREINVFDVFEGDSIGEGNKAYALSFILQDKQKTLTDKIIDKTMQQIMSAFEDKIGAKIRK
ncbi:MAG: phenylalanine--tRNA ligase subunit beta [Bacteroidota bacterium]|nr:phenylalanine--tRNA ligase subunit beta [Bacteroidota bacterium]